MTARGELMQEHLKIWDKFNTKGADPFGDLFGPKPTEPAPTKTIPIQTVPPAQK